MDESVLPWILVLTIVIIAFVAMQLKSSKYPMALVKSTVDNEYYLVRNLPDKQDACDRLARVRAKILILRTFLKQTYYEKPFVKQMLDDFDCEPNRFSESTPEAQYTSYSVNKGEKIFMCLRQRDEKEELVKSPEILKRSLFDHKRGSIVDHITEATFMDIQKTSAFKLRNASYPTRISCAMMFVSNFNSRLDFEFNFFG
jgi:hypothetical protein